MARAKVAISLDESTLDRLDKLVRKRVFPNPKSGDRRSGRRKTLEDRKKPFGPRVRQA